MFSKSTMLISFITIKALFFSMFVFAGDQKYVANELIVKLQTGLDTNLFDKKNFEEIMTLDRIINLSYGKLYVVKVDQKARVSKARELLKLDPEVKYAEPNYILSIADSRLVKTVEKDYTPNDPQFSSLWGLSNTGNNTPNISRGTQGADIGALAAWGITLGSKKIKIAVIDTGIDHSHPDLRENIWVNELEFNGIEGVDDDNNGYVDDIHGYDFVDTDGDPMDEHGHGTHCSGTIGSVHDNGIGVAGVMAKVQLVGIRYLDAYGYGTMEDAVKAIDYATKLNVDVMSNSWGGRGFSNILKEAIEEANKKGIVFVASAGNSTSDNDEVAHYPSNYSVSNVIAVAAHNINDKLAIFSSYGLNSVHVAAPGEDILSTWPENEYKVSSGSSMATPHVAGVLGLFIAQEGRLPVEEIKERLMGTSVPVRGYRRKIISGGRVNAYNLLKNIWPTVNEPDEEAWEIFKLDEVFESDHPYNNNQNFSRTITVPGAKYIRAKISKYDLEKRYDFLIIKDKNNLEVERVSSEGENYSTDYVEGDTITIEFDSDLSRIYWGFLIEELEVIKN